MTDDFLGVFSVLKRKDGDALHHTTILIQSQYGNGAMGRGTGFMLTFFPEGGSFNPTLITNKHAVDNAEALTLRLSMSSPKEYGRLTGFAEYKLHPGWEAHWYPHPDPDVDLGALAIAPILNDLTDAGHAGYGQSFSEHDIIPAEARDALNVIEPIYMIGYPTGLSDAKHNLPLVRKGITASAPAIPFNGKREFLIDCACFPGSSGSPVVLTGEAEVIPQKGGAIIRRRPRQLIGVLYAGPQWTAEGNITLNPSPTSADGKSSTPLMINIGLVIQAERILELKPLIVPTTTNYPLTRTLTLL